MLALYGTDHVFGLDDRPMCVDGVELIRWRLVWRGAGSGILMSLYNNYLIKLLTFDQQMTNNTQVVS
ncbi:hypothetical protein [Roseovarius rhodophyticola]|uniref:Uncharacterized protein n=1 Tax=Roseovarius rhodophyticola TaxID=3080827 RepID=A0ABZ2THY4_9RHOB|nr:hypothetical protein [Roseovarius sp. W115]